MFVCVLVFMCFAISPAVSAVAKVRNSCSPNDFSCSDGTCISSSFVCDGDKDCPDGRDETACYSKANISSLPEDLGLKRSKRQSSECRKYQWKCLDGTCIPVDGKCDGTVNCPDHSDETHALCRKIKCQRNLFRCMYGACVDGTAPCNGVPDCADNSDELLPRCRNETDVVQGRFRCQDGNTIPIVDRCDGVPNCPDGSDEILRACAGKTCPSHLFQCAYGACVDQNVDCNGQKECADGSDESDELCNKMLTRIKETLSSCKLPPYPEHGTYTVSNAPNASPGQELPSLHLKVTCKLGYDVSGSDTVFCHGGSWSQDIPACVRFCKLKFDPSVIYQCVVNDDEVDGRRPCKEYEPSGTIAIPECNKPNYHSTYILPYLTCIDGFWNNHATCIPECGRVTSESVPQVIDGWIAQRGELPWHVGIYRKLNSSYEQICGGSLVTNRVVLSAAHCFWGQKKKEPEANYAVAITKLYRDWDHKEDRDAQKSLVKDIHIPPRYQGSDANFQEDLAVVILETPFVYRTYVRPVCLDFGEAFDNRQLRPDNKGKVAGWGLTAANGGASDILKVAEIPYVDITKCIDNVPLTFKENISGDKICAGYTNGTALCRGDSGGGLTFPYLDHDVYRYYLRGIVSTAPKDEHQCNPNTLTTFTHIIKHASFVKQYL